MQKKLIYRQLFLFFKQMAVPIFWLVVLLTFFTLLTSLQEKETASLTSSVFSFFQDSGYIHSLTEYKLPYYWLLIHVCSLFFIDYPIFLDSQKNYYTLLLQVKNRKTYTFSLLCTIILCSLIFLFLFILIFLSSIYIVASTHKLFTFDDNTVLISQYLLLLYFSILLINMLCFILSRILSFQISIFLSVLTLIISTLRNERWLIGSQSLLMKQHFITERGLTLSSHFLITCIYFSVMTFLLFLCMDKKNFG